MKKKLLVKLWDQDREEINYLKIIKYQLRHGDVFFERKKKRKKVSEAVGVRGELWNSDGDADRDVFQCLMM